MESHEEYQYLKLMKKIIEEGHLEEGRNGKTKSIFGESMRFSLTNGKIPILTTKKTAWKTCVKELLWFIRGETDNKLLQEQGVHIWDGNASKEFMTQRGLLHYPPGHLGPLYGYQWRYFNAKYDCYTGKPCNSDEGIDQLQQIIDALKDHRLRTSRRLMLTSWNPSQLDEMALPPCHVLCQFNVHDGNKLSCALYQRSCDVPLGVPFNIASYSFLTHLLAKHCGLEAYEFIHFMGNAHIYEEHIGPIAAILERTPYDFPTLNIINLKEDINSYEVSDFVVSNYKCHDVIKMEMIA
jgi:thymidylate synthase